MPDPVKDDPNLIHFGRNDRGDFVIDGTVVEKNLHFVGDSTSEVPQDDDVPDRTNRAVEGQTAEPAKEPAPGPEPAKPAEPEPPKIPEKQKYKLMVRGEWQEKEYTQDELVARLQMAESYGIRNDELRQKHQKIEPFLHVFERPDFKEWLESKVAVGDIAPPAPPPPTNPDVIRYRLRTQEPEFDTVRTRMLAWAATLPDQEAEILNSDHKAFVDAYDHFKATMRTTAPAPPAPSVIPKKEVEKSIANKEVIKAQARVEPPGGAPQDTPDPKKEWEKEDRRLHKAVRNRDKSVMYNGQHMDPEIAWIMHRTG